MKIENFKEKLTALCQKEYRAEVKDLDANQLHMSLIHI